MIELRLRTRASDDEVAEKIGKILAPSDVNVLLTGPARVLKPDGRPLVVYLPGYLSAEAASCYPVLTTIRGTTNNRGNASGSLRVRQATKRTGTLPIMSSILGSFDAVGANRYCRLTAFTANEVAKWESLAPFFLRMQQALDAHVPDRSSAQRAIAARSKPEWLVPGTSFSTITVNNTYPTGVHTDKGDLDEGFSALAVLRRGSYSGGILTFPQYRVGVDLRDGDLVLMDAHEYHGNTSMLCSECRGLLTEPGHSCPPCSTRPFDLDVAPERISVVAYYRTKIAACGTGAEEAAKRAATREARNTLRLEPSP